MKRMLLASSLIALLTISGTAFAQNSSAQQIMSIVTGGDRYIAGATVSVLQASPHDLVVAGRTVSVGAEVVGSLFAAGGNVIVDGPVRGSARVFGGSVEIDHDVNGNLVVGGGSVHVAKNVTVNGSILLVGGQMQMDGTVNGDLQARGGSLLLSGLVKGSTDIQVQSLTLNGHLMKNAVIAAQNFDVEPPATMDKNLRYWQPVGRRDFGSVVKGSATYDDTLAIEPGHRAAAASLIADAFTALTIFSILSAALVIGLLLFATKKFFKDAAKYATVSPGKSLLVGFLYFLLMPIAAFILFLTVIGIPLALCMAAILAISLYFAKLLTAMVFTRWLEIRYKKSWKNPLVFLISLGLFILLKLISIVPFVGWLVAVAAACIGFGAILRAKYDRYAEMR